MTDLVLYADPPASLSVDAFAGALRALADGPSVRQLTHPRGNVTLTEHSLDEIVAIARSHFDDGTTTFVSFAWRSPSGSRVDVSLTVGDDVPGNPRPFPLRLLLDPKDVDALEVAIPIDFDRDAAIEVALAERQIHDDLDAALLGLGVAAPYAVFGDPGAGPPFSMEEMSGIYCSSPEILAHRFGLNVTGDELLGALRAVLVPDAHEARLARAVDEIYADKAGGVPTLTVEVTSRKHRQAQRAVPRLRVTPTGGVLLSVIPPHRIAPYVREATALLTTAPPR